MRKFFWKSPLLWALLFSQALLLLLLAGFLFDSEQSEQRSFSEIAQKPYVSGPAPAGKTRGADLRFAAGAKEIGIADYRGRALLVEFVNTRCPHCRRMAPRVARAVRKSGIDFLLVGVSGESYDRVRRWHREFLSRAMPGRVAVDNRGAAIAALDIYGTPTFVFLDSQGQVKELVAGTLSEGDLLDKIKRLQQ